MEELVLTGLKEQLMQPNLVNEFRVAFEQHLQDHREARRAEKLELERRLAKITAQIEGLVTAIAEGLRGASVQVRLDTLEAEKSALLRELNLRKIQPLQLPTNLAAIYREKVDNLQRSLQSPDIREQANSQIRQLIERVVVAGSKDAPEFELFGDLAAMIAITNEKSATLEGAALNSELRRSVKVVAGARFELTTFRL